MGKFSDQLRSDKIITPLRRTFTERKWTAEYKKLGEDESDAAIFEAGILIYKKLEHVRQSLKLATRTDVNDTTKIRAYVAITNREYVVLHNKFMDQTSNAASVDESLIMSDLINAKIQLPTKVAYLPDEILQSTVDGIEIAIRAIQRNNNLSGQAQFAKIKPIELLTDINLGVIYSQAESLWHDCLWNGFIQTTIKLKDGTTLKYFRATNKLHQKWLAISQKRDMNITMQFTTIKFSQILKSPATRQLIENTKLAHAIKKNGRNQIISLTLTNNDEDKASIAKYYATRSYATPDYYLNLLEEKMSSATPTIGNLLKAWALLTSIARIQISEIDRKASAKDFSSGLGGLEIFAQPLKINALTDALSKSASITLATAKNVISFLTYQGDEMQELWTQPIVRINNESVCALHGVLISANLQRVVNCWLQQMDFDMGRRGPLFETYMRTEIMDSFLASKFLKTAQVLQKNFVFAPKGERKEEIDLIITLQSVVIIAELKCRLQPAEAKQYAIHRNMVLQATDQIKRKVDAINRWKAEFRNEANKNGLNIPANFTVLPMVILNNPIHAGLVINDIPVIDEPLIRIFIDGVFGELARQTPEGKVEHLFSRTLYSSIDEAAAYASEYFSNPPQLNAYKTIERRIVPILSIDNDDWQGIYEVLDCKVSSPSIP